jgi:hypothetical protein
LSGFCGGARQAERDAARETDDAYPAGRSRRARLVQSGVPTHCAACDGGAVTLSRVRTRADVDDLARGPGEEDRDDRDARFKTIDHAAADAAPAKPA